jgi:hypothetical protein
MPFIQPMLQETGAEIRVLPQAPPVLESGNIVIVWVRTPNHSLIALFNLIVHGVLP